MKYPIKCAAFLAAFAVTGFAQAGPTVTIVFKNNGTQDAVYNPTSAQEFLTRSYATTTPLAVVGPGGSDSYKVDGRLSPDFTNASVQYKMGMKTCKFMSSYIMGYTKGIRAPMWRKEAVESNGARCEAKITTNSLRSHEWTVVFSMR